MVIAFGYVTLFASAFPLAAPLTIGCIWVERASDLWAFGHVSSFPFAIRGVLPVSVFLRLTRYCRVVTRRVALRDNMCVGRLFRLVH